ncbi:efflux transporter outer membrane subunit [Solimicrobium silvestre]|nr:efflux transporter outer membrane subunit [Solimicrobium silvestre]
MIATMLSACAVGPDFVPPASPTESRYTSEPQAEQTVVADTQAQHFSAATQIPADWWRLFKSEQLDAVVQLAIAHNPTLEASEATLRQSQDNLRAGYGVFYPQIDAGLNAARERSAPTQQGLQTPGSIFNFVSIGGSISYVLDVFGGQRRAVEGLSAQRDYQLFAHKAAYVTLSANVVNACIARAAYSAQIRATEELIALEGEQLAATEAQVNAGTGAYTSVLSMRSLIAANQGSLAPLKQKLSQAEHLLIALEGVSFSTANLPDIDLKGLSLPLALPVSLPSDLVRQRPDILQAEAQLHAASANIGVATAAMFPSFSLDGTFGVAGSSFGNLSAENGKFWSVGPSISIPLFRGGSLWFGRKAALDAYDQSRAGYRQTVLGAFEQVADSLKALEHDAESLQAQVESRNAAEEAFHLLQIGYKSGLSAYLDVLTADVQFHQANIAYLQAVAQRQQDTVALFVALGGGWWNTQVAAKEGKTP